MKLMCSEKAREKMRLIDADTIPYFGEVYGSHDRVTFKGRIDALPTVDAEPVRHGHWIWVKDHWECSVCRGTRFHDLILGLDAEYCGRCGAKMDETKGEQQCLKNSKTGS